MMDIIEETCLVCQNVGIIDGEDGYFYCDLCGSQVEGMIKTELYDDDHGIYKGNSLRRRRSSKVNPCQDSLKSQDAYNKHGPNGEYWSDGIGPSEPMDFGMPDKKEDNFFWDVKKGDNLRMNYVMGLQIIIQLQTEALVEKFGVSPMVCGLAGTIWFRYLASTGIFEEHWADEVIKDSEALKKGSREDFKPKYKHSTELFNIHGKRAVMLWYRALVKIIPLSDTLVIVYLVCHVAREGVVPTDIVRWSSEGKLPYLNAFIEIEKQLGSLLPNCSLSYSFMFKPSESISPYKLESQAASLAQKIGLKLPPVNFYAISARYLHRLGLESSEILRCVSQIYEWSMPPDLWLSASQTGLPTRVCVLAIIIVAIRKLYNINGLGYWEKSFSIKLSTEESPTNTTDSSREDSNEKLRVFQKSKLEAMKLLRDLEEGYDELEEPYEYSKNLPNYLQYCNGVVFAGMGSSYEDVEENNLIKQFWNYYQDKMNSTSQDYKCNSSYKRSGDSDLTKSAKESKKLRENGDPHNKPSHDDDAVFQRDLPIERLKCNMEENLFCYIPPRVRVKRHDYLQYVRKKDEDGYTYAAHADYYILLRSCARLASVDVRVMHIGVMSLERRLSMQEKKIDELCGLGPQLLFCKQCHEEKNDGCRAGPSV